MGALRLMTNWPGIGARKEGKPEQRKDREADDEDDAERDQRQAGPAQHAADQPVVELQEALRNGR